MSLEQQKLETEATAEARRVMQFCNACRYCEGFCAVFPAMEQRRIFEPNDLEYLANLCHNCNGCYHACQYAPPHEFAVNVPRAMAKVRLETYQRYAWPPSLGRALEKNGLVVSLLISAIVSLVFILAFALTEQGTMVSAHTGEGAFYEVIGHGLIVVTAGSTFLYSIMAMVIGFLRFWRASGHKMSELANVRSVSQALSSVATLRYLGGGHGDGCNTEDERFSNARRVFHQFTMWGFLLCFAATCVATVYEYFMGQISPFPILSLPAILGTTGGIGMLIGTPGLAWLKYRSDRSTMDIRQLGMDYVFLALLFLTSASGMLLLAFRSTAAMPTLLAFHFGVVLTLFVLMPYSKFVHSIYRYAALVRFALEERIQKARVELVRGY